MAKGVSSKVEVAAGAETTVAVNDALVVKGAMLWSPETPVLYSLRTIILGEDEEETVDELTVTFGFRSIRFDGKDGFFLNNQSMKIKVRARLWKLGSWPGEDTVP